MQVQSTATNGAFSESPGAPVFAVVVLLAALVGFALLVMAGVAVWGQLTAASADLTTVTGHVLALAPARA